MVNPEIDEEKINRIQKKLEKIMIENKKRASSHEDSDLVFDIYEAMKIRDKERIEKIITEDRRAKMIFNETSKKIKIRFITLLISLDERILKDNLLEVEKAFTVLKGVVFLMEEAEDNDEIIQTVLAGISEYMKCMDHRIKNSCHYLILSVKEHIHNKINTKINIAAISKELGTNYSYLSRLFHQKEGITIQQYICRERIRQAEKLLQFSAFTCDEISRCVGFASLSYFGKILKESTGLTPGQYRQRFGSKDSLVNEN